MSEQKNELHEWSMVNKKAKPDKQRTSNHDKSTRKQIASAVAKEVAKKLKHAAPSDTKGADMILTQSLWHSRLITTQKLGWKPSPNPNL